MAEPDGFEKALNFLKFDRDTISKLGKLKEDLVKLVGAVSWVVGAVGTFIKIAELLGLMKQANDPVMAELRKIGVRVEQLYGNELRKAKQAQYEQVALWRQNAGNLRSELWDLAITRTDAKVLTVDQALGTYKQAIGLMLSNAYAEVPFIRATYQYYDTMYPHSGPEPHWIDHARPFYMRKSAGDPPWDVRYAFEYKPADDGSLFGYFGGADEPAEIAYDPELKETIWDPGYYLDVLIHFVTMWISGLSLLEPVFRSTGHRRPEIQALADELERFARTWRERILVTKIDGPIDPGTTGYLQGTGHIMTNWTQPGLGASGIVLGAVDPVSGISAILPRFNEGFDVRWVQYGDIFSQGTFPGIGNGLYVLANHQQAVAAATSHAANLRQHVLDACGVKAIEDLAKQVRALAWPPTESETTRIASVDTRFGATAATGTAKVSLGLTAHFAGNKDDSYDAQRWRRSNVAKYFRLPMARRMDSSRLQLGYTLRLSLGNDELELELTEFGGPQDFGHQDLPVFPTAPITATFSGETTVYDVYDSGKYHFHKDIGSASLAYVTVPFNFDDEQLYENGVAVPGRERVWTNPRPGEVRLTVEVEFEYNVNPATSSFVGYADVLVSHVEGDAPVNYRARVAVDETIVGTDGKPLTRTVATRDLHVVGDILVPSAPYWEDRAVGEDRMNRAFVETNDRYARAAVKLGRRSPGEKVERSLEAERLRRAAGELIAREDPARFEQVIAQYQEPEL